MMDVVQAADLREETRERLVVLAPEMNRSRPIVAPFDHRARFQSVRTYFVYVFRISQCYFRPVTKREEVLQVSRSNKLALFAKQIFVILK